MRISDWSSDVCSSDLGGPPWPHAEIDHEDRPDHQADDGKTERFGGEVVEDQRAHDHQQAEPAARVPRPGTGFSQPLAARQSVAEGESVSFGVDTSGRRIINKK